MERKVLTSSLLSTPILMVLVKNRLSSSTEAGFLRISRIRDFTTPTRWWAQSAVFFTVATPRPSTQKITRLAPTSTWVCSPRSCPWSPSCPTETKLDKSCFTWLTLMKSIARSSLLYPLSMNLLSSRLTLRDMQLTKWCGEWWHSAASSPTFLFGSISDGSARTSISQSHLVFNNIYTLSCFFAI